MAQITIHNYEAYLLDFSEGNLPAELQVELEVFLMNHPELAVDLNELANFSLPADAIAFNHKDALKKTSSDLVSESQFIAYVEGQLNNEEAHKLERSCELNQRLSSELELYKQTILTADETIVFPDKAALKRQGKVIWFNFTAVQYSAAAAVLLIAGLFVLWLNSKPEGSAMMALKVKAENRHYKNATQPVTPTVSNVQDLSNPPAQTKTETNTNHTAQKHEPQQPQIAVSTNPDVQTKDTTSEKTNPFIPEKTANSANPVLLADNSLNTTTKSTTVVEVITENDDDAEPAVQKKKGFWAMAGRTLKTLNSAGVKAVNGNEEDKSNNTSYALTLGGINITHKSGKL